MTAQVPKLVPRRPGRAVQLLALLSSGTREITSQIKPYTHWWDQRNQAAAEQRGPLMVVVGDSTAIGIGASAPDRGYVGLIQADLDSHLDSNLDSNHGESWRVINLALSGARLQDALDRQLPILNTLPADLVLCCVGTNDLVWGRETTQLRRRLIELTTALPAGSIVATLAGMSARARVANGTIRSQAAELDLVALNPWNEPGPGPAERTANDRFHPNDLGYELMATAFGRCIIGESPPGA